MKLCTRKNVLTSKSEGFLEGELTIKLYWQDNQPVLKAHSVKTWVFIQDP